MSDAFRDHMLTFRRSSDLSAREKTLLAEVEELGRTIASAKAEIAAIGVDDIAGRHIPAANDELDAITTHAILAACETLDDVALELVGATQDDLQAAATRIYEACSFQDITGQRIGKVVTTLQVIEVKVAHIIAAFGGRVTAHSLPAQPAPGTVPLHGPQLPKSAMGQSDVDRLLASLD
jgi:chemotaxis protein CheZ